MNIIDNKFSKLGLSDTILKSLNQINYINPSPIQNKCIPLLLKGYDVLGLAKTGSGKTAAFSLPFLNNLNINLKSTQILVLVPTRELAIQVSRSIMEFAKFVQNINILALYGGQKYESQLRILRKGAQVVIGTPGRLLDHLQRGTLNLSKLKFLVLDEADEMLKMGFIEDVETIMKKIPDNHQTALFSATMPEKIRRITKKFMKNPKEISVDSGPNKLPDIIQRYCLVYGRKTDILMRFLEVEKFDAVIVFVRTKNATIEVSEFLEKHGYNSSPLNGDMNQNLREQTLERLKNGSIDILIATDVAARGLDVERISLVINYDIPKNSESYIHRIGRTGRAGRTGCALLFVENNERRLLKSIEHTININISEAKFPSTEQITTRRLDDFISKILLQEDNKDLAKYRIILSKIYASTKLDPETLSLFLLKLAQTKKPLILDKNYSTAVPAVDKKRSRYEQKKPNFRKHEVKNSMDVYKIEIGYSDGLKIHNIINSISNEFNIKNKNHIGNIKIFSNYTTLELSKRIHDDKNIKNIKNLIILNKKTKIQLIKKTNKKISKDNSTINKKFSFFNKKNNKTKSFKRN